MLHSHVEAITNIAATLYCLNRQDEAERNWLIAVKVRPGYLEAVEHLVGLLYKKRSREAIEIIEFVQQSLKIRPREPSHRSSTGILNSEINHMNIRNGKTGASTYSLFADLDQVQALAGPIQREDTTSPGFGSSGYAVPGKENGRILALIHAKGTMLYSLKEIGRASNAFEEAVLISTGRSMNDIQHLVHRIQSVLSPVEMSSNVGQSVSRQLRPLLLPPERARSTAQLVFGGTGELPGLHFVVDGTSKRAAVQTTSNSLLSLAKILQDAMSGGIVMPSLLRSPSGVGDILALYYLSISLQESPSTANNVGILLAGVQQGVSTGLSAGPEAGPSSGLPGIAPGSGLALALAYYHYGLRLDPKHVHLHTNLGSLLKDIGQLDLAIQMYEQAVSCDGTFDIALTNLANAVKDRGRINDAIMYYKRAVGSNPEFAEAVCGLFTALNSVCDWRGRGGVVLQSAKYDRWHVDENGLLIDAQSVGHGSGLAQRVVRIVKRQLEEASSWGMGILTDAYIALLADHVRHLWPSTSNDLETLLRSWAGKPWEGSRLMRLIERVNRIIQWRWYREQHFDITGSSSNYARLRLHPNLTMPSAPTVLPFHTFTCPLTARDIRVISQRNAVRISCSTLKLPWLPTTVYPPPNPPSPHLNVGYVSSDFNNHPLAHLYVCSVLKREDAKTNGTTRMQSVFGMHDSRRVRAVCYATSPSDKSAHRQKIEREAPVFRDVSNWTSEKLVDQIIQDGIHILVNLNGYTRGARNEIFAARPAPVQMSFMGFAGTLGAEWCDYILADTMAIPQETLRPRRSNIGVEDLFREEAEGDGDDWMYSENIVYCRDTFFCCDHAQSCDPAERKVSWEEEQRRRWTMRKELFPTMPDDVVILGNFNQLYKACETSEHQFLSWNTY